MYSKVKVHLTTGDVDVYEDGPGELGKRDPQYVAKVGSGGALAIYRQLPQSEEPKPPTSLADLLGGGHEHCVHTIAVCYYNQHRWTHVIFE